MALPTDYHVACRNGIATVLAAALLADYPALSANVRALDDPEEDVRGIDLPAVVVACVGPEQDRPEYGTNVRSGKGFPVAVLLMTVGVTTGAQAAPVPTMTLFRRLVDVTFDKQRLSGVDEVCECEVSDAGALWDKPPASMQALTTALIVNCVGRFPRA